MMVTGPSLTSDTFISAPKTPVCTRAPAARRACTTAPTSGSATGPGAAADQDQQAGLVDRGHDRSVDRHAGPADPLHHRSHNTAGYPAR